MYLLQWIKQVRTSESQSPRASKAHTTVPMPSNKVTLKNEKIVSRTLKSMDAETTFYKTKNDEKNLNKNTKSKYEDDMLQKSNDYAQFWIYNKGDRARVLIEAYYEKNTMNDPCYINVYNKDEKVMVKMKSPEIIEMIFKDFSKTLPSNRLGQTRIWNNIYISTEIYKFMCAHWEVLEEGSSVS